jgi:hypothetical protein
MFKKYISERVKEELINAEKQFAKHKESYEKEEGNYKECEYELVQYWCGIRDAYQDILKDIEWYNANNIN